MRWDTFFWVRAIILLTVFTPFSGETFAAVDVGMQVTEDILPGLFEFLRQAIKATHTLKIIHCQVYGLLPQAKLLSAAAALLGQLVYLLVVWQRNIGIHMIFLKS